MTKRQLFSEGLENSKLSLLHLAVIACRYLSCLLSFLFTILIKILKRKPFCCMMEECSHLVSFLLLTFFLGAANLNFLLYHVVCHCFTCACSVSPILGFQKRQSILVDNCSYYKAYWRVLRFINTYCFI